MVGDRHVLVRTAPGGTYEHNPYFTVTRVVFTDVFGVNWDSVPYAPADTPSNMINTAQMRRYDYIGTSNPSFPHPYQAHLSAAAQSIENERGVLAMNYVQAGGTTTTDARASSRVTQASVAMAHTYGIDDPGNPGNPLVPPGTEFYFNSIFAYNLALGLQTCKHKVYLSRAWTSAVGITEAYVGARLDLGCVYDTMSDAHILSPYAIFIQEEMASISNPNKRVYALGSGLLDLTSLMNTAEVNGGSKPVALSDNISTSDLLIPDGLF
jgi:hypothetical protein